MKRLVANLAVAFGALAFAASANGEVYWKQLADTSLPSAGQVVKKPRQMIVYKPNSAGTVCSGCGWRLVNLKWMNWGEAKAVGTGNAVPMGGPGTCGYPPKGCRYPYKEATVYLRKIQSHCGQRRYMRVGTVVDGFGTHYPKILCNGTFYIKPRPKPKPRLKRITAKSLFNRTVKDRLPNGGKGRKYLRCSRVARLRFRCRGKWEQIGYYDGGEVLLPFKIRGFVQRNDRSYRVRIRAKYWNVYGHGLPTGGPYYFTEWGFYSVR